MSEALALDLIRLDGGTQPRSTIFRETVDEYVASMSEGASFPALTVFFDGSDYWLADGFHRHAAAVGCGLAEFPCDIRQGTRRDAILFSVGANAEHGRPRTNEDKRRAVAVLLDDAEWSHWSDREVARRCHVSAPLVASIRPKAVTVNSYSEVVGPPTEGTVHTSTEPRTYVNKHGNTAKMRTDNIGTRAVSSIPAAAPAPPGPRPAAPSPFVDAFRQEMAQHGHLADSLRGIGELFDKLPSAAECARRYPRALRHNVNPERARAIAFWFDDFADAWEAQNGAHHVAAE